MESAVLRAPDFALTDIHGQVFRLSEQIGQRHIVLVFNRGFF